MSRLPAVALVLALTGCGSGVVPGDTTNMAPLYTDPETGGLTRSCPGSPVSVQIDAVDENGLLTIRGTATLPERRWRGTARFVDAYQRRGGELPRPPTSGQPYPETAPAPTAGATYVAAIYLDGRFVLRAPLAEVEADTVAVAYGCGEVWTRSVAELLID